MTTDEALRRLQSASKYGSRLGLERVAQLCARLGSPQDAVPTVHIAGTNGKGSTSAMLASVITAAGYKTGLYTSPYINDIRECLAIDGAPALEAEFTAAAQDVFAAADVLAAQGDPPTQFELETALAFQLFRHCHCDVAVIETGLGGRLDATNVIRSPLASVITSISLDHMAILGDTVEKITFEKCGILKPGGLTVSYPLQPAGVMDVICTRAEQEGNELFIPEVNAVSVLRSGLNGTDAKIAGLELHIPFIGAHQVWNAATAVQTVLALRERCNFVISDKAICMGIAAARMPLRQEVVSHDPLVLLDGAHNPDGLAALADTMRKRLAGRRTVAVMGMLADKDVAGSVALVAPLCAAIVAVEPQNARALPASALAAEARKHCHRVVECGGYKEALRAAIREAGEGGAVVVCGSLYVAGPMKKVYYVYQT